MAYYSDPNTGKVRDFGPNGSPTNPNDGLGPANSYCSQAVRNMNPTVPSPPPKHTYTPSYSPPKPVSYSGSRSYGGGAGEGGFLIVLMLLAAVAAPIVSICLMVKGSIPVGYALTALLSSVPFFVMTYLEFDRREKQRAWISFLQFVGTWAACLAIAVGGAMLSKSIYRESRISEGLLLYGFLGAPMVGLIYAAIVALITGRLGRDEE